MRCFFTMHFPSFANIGLDEPSYKEPILREYLHWLVVNVPGNNYHKGQELAFYKGPEPAKGTGLENMYS